MKSAAVPASSSSSRAIAQQAPSQQKGIAFPAPVHNVAPIQMQLAVGQTYKATFAVAVFSTPKKRNTDANLTVNNLYTVNRVVGNNARVELYEHGTGAKFVMADGNDASFESVVPRLDDDEHLNAQNDPGGLVYKDYHTNAQPVFSRDHVSEGNTGDCWLLGPLAAMAQSPKWRAHLLANFQINVSDFTIRLYTPGLLGAFVALQQTVSGHLPTYKATDTTTGVRETVYGGQQKGLPDQFDANPNLAPIWPAIFEKAAAIVKGGYQALDDKEASEGMSLLGGQASIRVTGASLLDPQWHSLKVDQFDKEAAITMTTKKNADIGMLPAMAVNIAGVGAAHKGLLEDHVYVVKVLDVNDVELHNPHGGHHPTARLTKAEVRDYISWVDCLPGN